MSHNNNAAALFPAPYIYTGMNALHTAILVLSLLSLQMIVMGLLHDFASIAMIISAGAAATLASFLIGYLQGRGTFDIHALVTGLLIGFFLPVTGGFVFGFLIAFMSYFFSWGVFGGKGSSWINPVMLAACIAAVCKPECFVQPVALDRIASGGSVFAALEGSGLLQTPADHYITSMFNSTFLHGVDVTLPEGYIGLFLYYPSVVPAFRYNLLTLCSSIVLLSAKTIHKTLPFTFLIVYGLLVYLFPSAGQSIAYGKGDIISALLTSGALFSAFFVMNDTGSIPRSWEGRFITGILIGLFAFCIAGPGAIPAGIPFAVLFVDCITPLIEWLEAYFYTRRRGSL